MSHLLLAHFTLQYFFSRVPAVHTSCQFSFSTLLIRCSVTSQRESKLCTQGVFATDREREHVGFAPNGQETGTRLNPRLTRGTRISWLWSWPAGFCFGRLELFEVVHRVHRLQPTAAADRRDINISDITGFKRPKCWMFVGEDQLDWLHLRLWSTNKMY